MSDAWPQWCASELLEPNRTSLDPIQVLGLVQLFLSHVSRHSYFFEFVSSPTFPSSNRVFLQFNSCFLHVRIFFGSVGQTFVDELWLEGKFSQSSTDFRRKRPVCFILCFLDETDTGWPFCFLAKCYQRFRWLCVVVCGLKEEYAEAKSSLAV